MKCPAVAGLHIMRIVFLGDSHAHALIRALGRSSSDGDVTAVDVRRIEGDRANAKEIPLTLAQTFPADVLFCCLGGTEYNLLGLIESAEPFDFMADADDSVLPGRKTVPNGLVRAALVSRMRSALGRMADVRAQYDCPFICVAPPPPFAVLDDTANLPRAFVPHLESGIAPASIRRKLYAVQVALLEAHCRNEGIGFMAAPAEALDSDGYLRREYWNNDPTHGNALYGQAVIGQMKGLQLA